eukprot:Gb_32629 [translate_table: standard]
MSVDMEIPIDKNNINKTLEQWQDFQEAVYKLGCISAYDSVDIYDSQKQDFVRSASGLLESGLVSMAQDFFLKTLEGDAAAAMVGPRGVEAATMGHSRPRRGHGSPGKAPRSVGGRAAPKKVMEETSRAGRGPHRPVQACTGRGQKREPRGSMGDHPKLGARGAGAWEGRPGSTEV